jgi:UDP-N-acetyl-D-mannosaminuronic acid transferase (WecB/TagA/CpsF family)
MKVVLLVNFGLLESKTAKDVNIFGLKICCDTARHFITTYKKKFATTTMKYLMAINPSN